MTCIRSFKAVRPREDLAAKIAALPYDVYNRQEASKEIEREPLSFLKVDRAETFFSENVDTYDACVYEKARETLQKMVTEGQLIQEKEDCYYIYELTMNQRVQTGIVACASVDDYLDGTIKKHENTRADKEKDRICHVDICNAQTGPIFLAYPSCERINNVVKRVKQENPLYDFVATDRVRHRAWRIEKTTDKQCIKEQFAGIKHLYIADGHHRCASAVKVALQRRQEHPDYTGAEEFNFFLSVLFPDEQLMIMDYNRVIKDLKGFTKETLLQKLEQYFQIKEQGNTPYKPMEKGTFGMYMENTWYQLTLREAFQNSDAVSGLDVSILQDLVLRPFFGIEDPKTDKNIDFVGGIRGLEELEKRVHTDCKLAFSMYPTSIEELFAVADVDRLMPPKSTWFEPKLRSGLFIHCIGE